MGSWEETAVPSIARKLCILLLLIFLGDHAVGGDTGSDKTALLAFKAAVGGHMSWNQTTSPCSWQGIQCMGSRVTDVRLPGVGMIGSIPVGTLGNLSELRVLSLRWNLLSGSLPSDLANCTQLRNLYLQNNQFTGPLPSFFNSLPNLIRLNLAFNRFTGPIPTSLGNMKRLGTLYLQNNSLTGSIPAGSFYNVKQFNVSNNKLNGSVPSALQGFPMNSFTGNSLCGSPLASCPGVAPAVSPSSGHKGKNKLGAGAIVGIVLGCLGFLALLFLLILFLCKGKKKTGKPRAVEFTQSSNVPDDAPEDRNPKEEFPAPPPQEVEKGNNKRLVFFEGSQRKFDLEDLLRASAEVLGKGSVGTAYKAVLEFGLVVAVKRLRDVVIGQKEFVQQIEQVGKMQHQNLVPLRAYYFSKDEKLLVYDYMTMGSLSSLLHGNRGAGRTPLDWETRSRIALGAARGIEYLHSRGREISHGNIKSSNILLTTNYNAGVSDFGLAQLVSATPSANRIVGYRAPEVTDARKISQKADVYSFGVLLLEILTGKAPSHGSANDDGVDLPRWVQSIVREEWTAEVFDIELLRHHNFEEDMVQLLQIAIDCVAHYPDQRPSMEEVVRRIEDLGQNIEDDDDAGTEDQSSSAETPELTGPVKVN